MDYAACRFIQVEKEGAVALVTLNRPEALNALGREGHIELENVFEALARDDEVRAVILTGAGKAFSAGGDIKDMHGRVGRELNRPVSEVMEVIKGGRRLLESILDMEKPVIAAVNGVASGLGATLALVCDIVIAADNATIGDAHIRMGIVPGDGGLVFWPLLVGPAKAKEMLMTGDYLSAREAERLGLINRMVPSQELMPACKELAKRLSEGPAIGIACTKLAINKMIKQWFNTVFDIGFAMEMQTFNTEDHREAATAFVEKRKPRFRGK